MPCASPPTSRTRPGCAISFLLFAPPGASSCCASRRLGMNFFSPARSPLGKAHAFPQAYAMTSLPVTQARSKLYQLLDEAAESHEPIQRLRGNAAMPFSSPRTIGGAFKKPCISCQFPGCATQFAKVWPSRSAAPPLIRTGELGRSFTPGKLRRTRGRSRLPISNDKRSIFSTLSS